eukprot:7217939-Pyramimonas_sp.AAC.1
MLLVLLLPAVPSLPATAAAKRSPHPLAYPTQPPPPRRAPRTPGRRATTHVVVSQRGDRSGEGSPVSSCRHLLAAVSICPHLFASVCVQQAKREGGTKVRLQEGHHTGGGQAGWARGRDSRAGFRRAPS